jgi:uncharacterized protein YcbK (DUF882 family)
MTQLSEHFTLEEMYHSDMAVRRGIDNTPTAVEQSNLKFLCLQILEPIRAAVKQPVRVSSGFRNTVVNKLVGGEFDSVHQLGLAADITVHGMTSRELAQLVYSLNLPFDQIIMEYPESPNGGWVHVSASPNPRRECLSKHQGQPYVKGFV